MSCDSGTDIYSTAAGTVVAISGNAAPMNIFVAGSTATFNNLKAIITSVGIQQQGGYQFMHTLRAFVYVYVFMERVGDVVINGLAFPASCAPLGSQDYPATIGNITGETGIERITQWYEANRITSRATSLSIGIGNSVSYEAFLLSMKADIVDASTGVAQFSMRFSIIPNITDSDIECFD